MDDDAVPSTLDRLKARRESLGRSAGDLERAVTRAAGDLTSWQDGVRAALDRVGAALAAHVEEVEAPDGLFADVAANNPRLLPAVGRLRRDHEVMGERIGGLATLVAAEDPPVPAIRQAALDLLTDVSGHRHRGADLLWELYDVDIGGGG